ncbi:PHAF1 protein CG7083 [Eupeodes corollae]|uniref:PHAF1 protein CG7083 n=1 Tax=Eupeodes corollae TaxID=290404 RepID=UPI002490769D|nr:PHAF1 protein CG7083 [Eupeodes corollae]
MLDLEVVPEKSLGCDSWEFVLGMHFSQAIAIIQSQVGIIKGVQVLYSDTNPLGVDIIINLPQDGIRLIFDPVVQRLKTIEVFSMKLVKLKYGGVFFNSPEVLPSIEQIEHSFGATHPGVYDAAKQLFALHFRGLSFYFPVDSKLQAGHAHGMGSLVFLNGASPVVSKMSLYSGSNVAENRPPPLPLSCYNRQLHLESASVLRNPLGMTRGLKLKLFTEGSGRALEPRRQCFTKEIIFGDSCQDVAINLGAPNRIFFKSEDKMKIHSSNVNRQAQSKRSDIFFNYFTLGIDILFDARTQTCKKFILHTNYPGHFNFNMYHRCEFQFQLKPDKVLDGDKQMSSQSVPITAYSKWDDISSSLVPSERPVVLHRASSTNTANPFGSTFCYGYQDIIFEVMPNKHIASVTLYNTSPSKQKEYLWQNNKMQDIRLTVA